MNLRRFVTDTNATYQMKFKYNMKPMTNIELVLSVLAKKGINLNWVEITPSYNASDDELFNIQFITTRSHEFAKIIGEEDDFVYTARELEVLRDFRKYIEYGIVLQVQMKNQPGELSQLLETVRNFKLGNGQETHDFLFSHLNIGGDNVMVFEPRFIKFKDQ